MYDNIIVGNIGGGAVLVLLLVLAVGLLSGVLIGGVFAVRYLRHEVAADIGPRLRRVQLQLDNLETAVNLAIVTRYAELSRGTESEGLPHQERELGSRTGAPVAADRPPGPPFDEDDDDE